MRLHVASKFQKIPDDAIAIDTTSSFGRWMLLSPFLLPGGRLYGEFSAQNIENAWQFAKLYTKHADAAGNPTDAYWAWAEAGWSDKRAHRYPMGKGARPLCSLWGGSRLGYIDARIAIYAPLYARAVLKTTTYADLKNLYALSDQDIYLRDYDGYDHVAENKPIEDVIRDPKRKMGHAFVLWMLLTGYTHPGLFEPERLAGSLERSLWSTKSNG